MFGAPDHAPGSVDPRTGGARPGRWATERQMEAIVYLAASDRSVTHTALGRDLAHEGERLSASACEQRGRKIMMSLASLGLMVMPRHGHAVLTERGRIAAALILYRNRAMLPAYFDEDWS